MLRTVERLALLGASIEQQRQVSVVLCNLCDHYYLQKRMRRRTTTPPPWVPKPHERWLEQIDPSTKQLRDHLIKMEQQVRAPIVRANPHMSLKQSPVKVPQNELTKEWTSESKRVGLLAEKIGMFPQWTIDGTRLLCTLLHFPNNIVVSTNDPDTWYRTSIVGKRKAYGKYGPRWSITVGAADADPTKYRSQYRGIFERRGLPLKKHIATFLVTEDAVLEPGTPLHVCHFKVGQHITATGKTIDWGFQGGMHRWGFKGMPALRTTKSHRRIGAIGSKGDRRVRPGKRMPGHMGYEWRSTGGLEVLRINPEKQVMYINGCVPGEIGDFLLIKDCLKDKKAVQQPHFPTYFLTDAFGTEDLTDAPYVFENGEYFAKRLFRFTMPSIVFSEADEEKFTKRDKTKAKIAKITENRRAPRAILAARLPHLVLLSIFDYLSIRDLGHCMLVCKHWWTVLQYPDSFVWENLARRTIPKEAISDPSLLSEILTFKEKLCAYYNAWNPNDSSRNNYLRSNGFTIHRNPVAQSTDGVRGKIGVNSGIHAYEFTWEGPLGTVACIGVATKHAALHCHGYVALLGSDDQSWGWNLVDNQLMHNSNEVSPYPRVNNPPKYQIGERIRMVVDCDQHLIYFEKSTEFLGVAFSNLPPVKLFPAMCAVYGNTEVSMVYIGPPSLG